MKEFFMGFDPATRTILVFTIVLLTFILVPANYLLLKPNNLYKTERKPIFTDWRILIPILVYAILLGFRYDYSFDWDQYMNTFEYMSRGLIYRDDTEKGYLLINRLLSSLGFNYYSIFILECATYVTAYCYLLKSDRRYIPFALPLVYMAQYSNALNISRQFFAMSVLFIAYRFLLDKKKIPYFIIGGIACTIHSSAIIWIVVFYFFSKLEKYKEKLKLKYFLIACIICYVINTLFRARLYELFSTLTDFFQLKAYLEEGNILDERFLSQEVPLYRVVVQGVKFLTFYYLYYKQKHHDIFTNKPIIENFVLIGIISAPLVLLVANHEIFSRMFYYVSVFYDLGWGVLYTILFIIERNFIILL